MSFCGKLVNECTDQVIKENVVASPLTALRNWGTYAFSKNSMISNLAPILCQPHLSVFTVSFFCLIYTTFEPFNDSLSFQSRMQLWQRLHQFVCHSSVGVGSCCCQSLRCCIDVVVRFFNVPPATIITMSSLLTATSALLILHAAYSCLHYRNLLTDLEESGIPTDAYNTLPPSDVWMEAFLALAILLVGELTRKGSTLQPVVTTGTTKKNIRAPAHRTRDFDIYTSRGNAL